MENEKHLKPTKKGLSDDRIAKAALIKRKAARDEILRRMEDKKLRDQYEL